MDKDDPYAPQCELPGYCEFQCRMVAGVVNVYRDAEALDRDEPLHLPYPQLYEFLADQAVLTRLISDGPLYATVCLSVCLSVFLTTHIHTPRFNGRPSMVRRFPLTLPIHTQGHKLEFKKVGKLPFSISSFLPSLPLFPFP